MKGAPQGQAFWRDGWLLSICVGRVFTYATFMVYAGCLPILTKEWEMSATRAGSIAAGFTFGYAASLVVASLLAERFGARRIFLLSAISSAVTSLAFGLLARDYVSALLFYTLAALTQGGLYTPGLVLLAERYPAARRGSAVGWFIASTSVGYAFSLIVSGLLLALGGYSLAFLGTGLAPMVGASILWAALRRTPNTIHRRDSDLQLTRLFWKNADVRCLVAGYTCHSWELLGMWAWAPAFLAASLALDGVGSIEAAAFAAYLIAAMHMVGAVASSSMGYLSDLLGRRTVLIGLGAAGGALSLTFGWLANWPVPILAVITLIYGFVALGDSPVLSTALTEAVAPGYLGAVLGGRALLGFGAGAISPVVFGAVLDTFQAGGDPQGSWGPAFMVLAAGGLGAAWFAWRFRPPVRMR